MVVHGFDVVHVLTEPTRVVNPASEYHLIVPFGWELVPNETVPVPHLLPSIAVGDTGLAFTVVVIVFEFAVVDVGQVTLEVKTTDTVDPFVSDVVV